MRQSLFFRVKYFFGKKFLFYKNISRIKGSDRGSKILVNSLPKAGTHLLENIVEQFPGVVATGNRTLRGNNRRAILKKMARAKKGAISTSHLPYLVEYEAIAAKHEIRLFEVIRDPRDIVVSRYKYLSEIDTTHKLHDKFTQLANDNDKLMLAILGEQGVLLSLKEMLENHLGWLSSQVCCVVRFESLIGPIGGGTVERQLKEISRIANFLNYSLESLNLEEIVVSGLSQKSLTLRKPKVAGWRDYFNQEHVDTIKELSGDLLVEYGYEKNLDW